MIINFKMKKIKKVLNTIKRSYKSFFFFFPLLLLLFSCGKKEKPLNTQNCETIVCASSMRLNGDLLYEYRFDSLSQYSFNDGYLVLIARQKTEEQTVVLSLRVGSLARPVYQHPGTYSVDYYNTAFVALEIFADTSSHYKSYGGYIKVDTAGPSIFAGNFEIEAKSENVELYLKLIGNFNLNVESP
ncbi:MAG: hypothetical protein CVT92_12035 [Bacteroidetes bacterium HGW-Bacteroidetes-1]|jgi:hypothetical protein|nr:MAG: hypothetical protein CVT92_12035 [Bacteroidetes bacterium HGW-Bacteroidetes-1]